MSKKEKWICTKCVNCCRVSIELGSETKSAFNKSCIMCLPEARWEKVKKKKKKTLKGNIINRSKLDVLFQKLKQMEWCDTIDRADYKYCPVCGIETKHGHSKSCKLAEIIKLCSEI